MPDSVISPSIVTESDLFSKYTHSVERKLPEEIQARNSGESDKSGINLDETEGELGRSGTEIKSGKGRVSSIMSPEEESKYFFHKSVLYKSYVQA